MLKKVVIISIILIFVISIVFIFLPKYPLKYADEINFFCNKYNVSNALVFSIIKAESDFKKDAVSSKNAIGLMQIKTETASFIMNEKVSEDDLKTPHINIAVGTKYLRYLLDKFSDIKLVICAYNAGEGNVAKWLKNDEYFVNSELVKIPIEETNNYYKSVTKNLKNYEKILTKKDLKVNF